MATYSLTRRPAKHPHNQHVKDGAVRTKSIVFYGAEAAAVKGSAVGSSDVYEILEIPAGAFVMTVTHQVRTVEGGTCTYHIGDSDVDGYVVSGNGNTTTDASSFNGTTSPAYGVGKYYAAADTIDLSFPTGTAANLVLEVAVTYFDAAPVVAQAV